MSSRSRDLLVMSHGPPHSASKAFRDTRSAGTGLIGAFSPIVGPRRLERISAKDEHMRVCLAPASFLPRPGADLEIPTILVRIAKCCTAAKLRMTATCQAVPSSPVQQPLAPLVTTHLNVSPSRNTRATARAASAGPKSAPPSRTRKAPGGLLIAIVHR